MGIKKSVSVFLLIGSVFTAWAQQTSKCEEAFAVYEANVKALKYDETLVQMEELTEKCSKINEKLYTYGEKALTYKIDASRTDEERKANIDKLFNLYARYDKNFPGNKNANDVKKALLTGKYKLASDDEVFKLYDAAFKNNKQNFINPEALDAYYSLYLKQFEDGKKGITQADFVNKNAEISAQVAYASNKFSEEHRELLKKQETTMLSDEEKQFLKDAGKNGKILNAVNKNINILSSKYVSCEAFEGYYTEKFEANKTNADWLESLVSVLIDKKCYKSEVLQKGAEALYEVKPDGGSAMYLATIAQRKNHAKEAVKYYDIAAQYEAAAEEKADIFFTIASIYRNIDKALAKKYAIKSAQTNPKSGKPYIFLAEMYSAVTKECDLSGFDRKALYWLAIETVKKAEQAEPRYKATVAAIINGYSEYAPTKSDAKAAGKKKGDKITYGCWINETLTVPNL